MSGDSALEQRLKRLETAIEVIREVVLDGPHRQCRCRRFATTPLQLRSGPMFTVPACDNCAPELLADGHQRDERPLAEGDPGIDAAWARRANEALFG